MKAKKILYIVTFSVSFTGIFLLLRGLHANSIQCSSQYGPCSELISEKLLSFQGQRLGVAKKQISLYLTSDPSIKAFSIRFKIPNSLFVSILEKKSRYALKAKNEEVYANVDINGDVLAIRPESALPFVVISNKLPNLGDKVMDEYLFALGIQEKIYSSYQVRRGELQENYLKVVLSEGYTVFFPLTGDIDKLLGALSLIIYELKRSPEDSRIEGKGITTIDLRFTNPVLR